MRICRSARYGRARPISPRRGAWSLVELLVAVSILAVLVALLLPGIQASRETSRKTSCVNNLKQVGVAILNFESARKHFPKGAEGRIDRLLSPTNMVGLSWWAEVMGFLGEAAVNDGLDRKGSNTGWVYLNLRNGKLIDNFGPAFFFCPSSTVEHFNRAGDFQVAMTSYTGISGATSHDGYPETRVNRCCRSEGEISGGGVLVPNAVVRARQISDGLSRTFMVGEQSDWAFSQKKGFSLRIGSSWALGWIAGTSEIGTPPNYSDWLTPSYNLATVRYRLNEHRYDLPGIYLDIGANNPLLSSHPGIVNLLRCDGSVQSVDDSIAVEVLKSLSTRDDFGMDAAE